MISVPDCPICLLPFNKELKIPYILPNCGHNICVNCLPSVLENPQKRKCPECKIEISKDLVFASFQKNACVIDLLKKNENCQVHSMPLKYLCMDDYTTICERCVERKHKCHELVEIKLFKGQMADKRRAIKEIEHKLIQINIDFQKKRKEARENLLKAVEWNFKVHRYLLDIKEEEICAEINREFSEANFHYFDLIVKSTLEDVEEALTYMKQPGFNKDILDAFRAEYSMPDMTEEVKKQEKAIQNYNDKVKGQIDGMMNSIIDTFIYSELKEIQDFKLEAESQLGGKLTQKISEEFYFEEDKRNNKLEIHFNKPETVTDTTLVLLVKILENLPKSSVKGSDTDGQMSFKNYENVSRLVIDLSNCSKIKNDSTLDILGKSLLTIFPNLKDLEISFRNCTQIENSGFMAFLTGLKNIISVLDKISLNFDQCPNFTDMSLLSLGDVIEESDIRLSSISLICTSCKELEGTGVKSFIQSLVGAMENLKNLHLDFHNCTKLSPCFLENLGALFQESPSNLESLYLNTKGLTPLNDEIFEKFFNGMKSVSSITSFKLHIGATEEIKKSGRDHFLEMLNRLGPKLKELELFASERGVDYSGFRQLIPGIFDMEFLQLERLGLYLNCSSERIIDLSTNLTKSLRNLKEIKLDVWVANKVDDSTIKNFSENLGHLNRNLRDMKLGFVHMKECNVNKMKDRLRTKFANFNDFTIGKI